MTDHLFVYGSLRPALMTAEVAGLGLSVEHVDGATVRGRLYDLGAFSGAVLDESAPGLIVGDVLRLADPATLAALDDYEGYHPNTPPNAPQASPFVRARCLATLSSGRQLECWIYAYNREVAADRLIGGGDYLDFLSTIKQMR